MTAIVRFTPLYGTTEEEPLSYLLEIDEFKILLDCGWTPLFNLDLLAPLAKVAKNIDAVLISYPDLSHLGALPYAVGKLGLTAPIYATIPVYKMGQMFLYDIFQNRQTNEDFSLFSLDDVDAAFDKFVQLKYSQRVTFEERGAGIEAVAVCGGHLIGGTIWKIKKETEEIIYAVDFNHKKERHLNGTVLENLTRPTLLITDTLNILNSQLSRKNRDNELLDLVMKTLRSDGDVLMPVDTAGRVLELLIVLDQYWTQNKLANYSLVLLSNVAFNTVEFAKSQLEWMNDTIMNAFNYSRENPFALKYVRLCHDREQLEALPTPRVVLASSEDLESGFAQELFVEYAEIKKNTIIWIQRPPPFTLGARVLELQTPTTITVNLKRRIPLEGEELEEYKKKKEEKEEQERKKREEEENEVDSESEDDNEAEQASRAFMQSHDMNVDSFYTQGFRYPIFPYFEKRSMFDEYGEELLPGDYLPDIEKHSIKFEEPIKTKKEQPVKDEMEIEEVGPPTKCVQNAVTVTVNCTIKYIDFEGRSDGRSIKTILQHIAPRKMILVHGSRMASDHLKKFFESSKDLKTSVIFIPRNEENVLVTTDSNVFKVKLSDPLVDSLQFTTVGDYQIALLNGRIGSSNTSGDIMDSIPTLDKLPENQIPEHNVSLIGEVKLYDLKPILNNAGYKAELQGGLLIVLTSDGYSVSIRKEELGGGTQFKIEGLLSEDYFKIRQLIYSQFTII